MKVLVAGENPFVSEIGDLVRRAGHDALLYLIEDYYDAIESGFILAELPQVDVAIEIHNESAGAKQELLLSLSHRLREDTILLTSAFVVSTTAAAAWVAYPDRVVGFGLLPPLGSGSVVELAAGINTDRVHVERAQIFWESLGMACLVVRDGAGLVSGRLLASFINEAIFLVQENVASPEEIDRAAQNGGNLAMGPLALADYWGLDAVSGIMEGLYAETRDPRYRPAPLLQKMVLAGRHGEKSGEGFFLHPAKS